MYLNVSGIGNVAMNFDQISTSEFGNSVTILADPTPPFSQINKINTS